MTSFKDEWVQENVDIVTSQDRAIHDLEIKHVRLDAEIKEIKSLASIAVAAGGLDGNDVAGMKVLA